MRIVFILISLSMMFFSCNNEQSQTTEKTKVVPATVENKANNPAALAAQKKGKASASTLANMSMGFWHIGGSVNTTEGDIKYEGQWLKFAKDQTFVFGKDEKTISSGVWSFNEDEELITLSSENAKETYFLNEFKSRQIGDIILWTGNTTNNPRGTQIKLVRQDTKVIDHNPN